ncbi:MAG: YhfC family intramembrane metalloprotease [Chloroflexi bacterium]|nr:YhfC family intramembrane metalloprotease [Chloroflexota bacterium]MCI0576394.1 YhfC family intramembrane metalloprotease [Chloroflexota bacterium]MCI0644266.1 YhfC family intramembrane metalloprotease [Chloroflexota bacterium]MCI0726249.1 YhfC family intramembrane metalloprotease [Chloroflexota bacterium]
MLTLLLTLNGLLMIAMPVALGWFIARRRPVGWGLFGIGAATFIISQVGHIPFNLAIQPGVASLLEGLPETTGLAIMAGFLGLSAGVFEEVSRYLVYRYWATEARRWSQGVMLGAGHGGAESILLGLLFMLNFLFLAGYRAGWVDGLLIGLDDQELAVLQQQAGALFSIPWYDALLGAVERLFTLGAHLSFSLLVLQVFSRGRLRWLAAAVGWHAVLDAVAVFASQTWNPYITEGLIGLAALLCLAIVFWLKEPEPVAPALEPLPAPGLAAPLSVPVTAENLDESRYVG